MPVCGLTILSLALAYAVYQQGGVWTRDWNVCLLEIGLLAIAYRLAGRKNQAPPLDRLSQWLLVAFIAVAAVQILPLPVPLVRVLSPARVDLLAAASPVVGVARFVPLSATPAITVEHLLRIGGYFLVFLLVRDLAWQLKKSAWLPVMPLVAIAAFEAAWGLFQWYSQGAPEATGTYVNHNHFAGFLEMCLPFAVLYPAAILGRPQSPGGSPAAPVLKACGLLLIGALIFIAILHSLSRMGVVATLLSLFTVGCLAVAAKRGAGKRRFVIASLAVLALLAVVLLPGALVARFAVPVSTGDFAWRVHVWRDTLGLIKAFPLFGCGLGAYESCLPKYQTVSPMFAMDFAHNDYLQWTAELGVIGFLIGLVFLLRLLAHTVRTAMNATAPDRRYAALACTGSLVAILAHSLTDFNLYIPANAMLLAWICGFAASRIPDRVPISETTCFAERTIELRQPASLPSVRPTAT